MATIDTALYTRLSGLAAITALVSTRIYPLVWPQNGTFPLIVYQQISAQRNYAMGVQLPVVRARFQFDIYATTQISCRAIALQVRLALSKYGGTVDTVVIDHIEIENEMQLYEAEVSLHRISQDYIVWFRETTP